MTDLAGQALGPYQLIELIGHGGMSNVYRAIQPAVGRQVAVKVLPAHLLHDGSFLSRFIQEAKVIAALQHPRILPIYDFGEHNGLPYLVMAYIGGGSLSEHIEVSGGDGIPLHQIVRWVDQIAEGLDFAHENGIIHRDFKPGNVLLDEKGNVYLADFGLAKVLDTSASISNSGITGTPRYMAPEMASGEDISPLVDIYALGITLFEMLTGRQPYEAHTPMAVLVAHVTQPIPDLLYLRPDLPQSLQVVINRAMAKEPDNRYQSAGKLASALRASLAGHLDQPEPPRDNQTHRLERPEPYPARENTTQGHLTLPPLPTQPNRRRKVSPFFIVVGFLLVAAAALLILGLQFGWLAGSETPEPEPSLPTEAVTLPGDSAEAGLTVLPAATEAQPSPTADVTNTVSALADPVTVSPSETAAPLATIGPGQEVFNCTVGGNAEICLSSAEGAGSINLTNNPAADNWPMLSHDGTRILFISDRDGNEEVYIMNADGSGQTNLSQNPEYDFRPTWSPDGSRIAWETWRDGNAEIYVMNVDGSGQINMTQSPAHDQWPTWSPDGSRIVFVSWRDGNSEIYVMGADGSWVDNLTRNPAGDWAPGWSWDGSQITFTRDGVPYLMNIDGSNQQPAP